MKQEEIEYLNKYYLHLLPGEVKHTIKYPFLIEEEREIEKTRLSKILLENYGDKIFWNLCPNCGELARTPKAKQCRHCNQDWH